MMNRIKVYERLKEDVKCKRVVSCDALKTLVDDFINSFWGEMDNTQLLSYEGNLETFSTLHMCIIQDAIDQLGRENSPLNFEMLQTFENVRNHINMSEDGKTAVGIVSLHKACEYYIVGDIHSDDDVLNVILEKTFFYEKIFSNTPFRIVFLGDYVDRGFAHLKTMEHILLLKILFPENICLLRGNHDGGKLSDDGVVKLPYRIPDKDDPMWYFPRYLERLIELNKTVNPELLACYLDLFDHLPYIAFLSIGDKVVQCVHGGLPKPQVQEDKYYAHLSCLADLTKYEALDNVGATILENIMWSDPLREGESLDINRKRFNFTQAHFEAYKTKFGIDLMLRGHEVVEDGVRSHFDGQLYTLFSSGHSKTSFYHWVNPKILKISPIGEIFELWLFN